MNWRTLGLSAWCFVGLFLAEAYADQRQEFQAILDEATANPDDPTKFARLLEKFPKTKKGDYVVDGDILLTDGQIREILRQRKAALQSDKKEIPKAGELIVNTESGVRTCYRTPTERRLTYAIDTASFASAPRAKAAQNIKANVAAAAAEWVAACPECGFKFVFVHKPNQTPADVSFVVTYNGNQDYIAAAFFPNDAPERRYLSIAQAYYTAGFDPIGVLRHEIGHILGYRHEHIRPEAPFQCRIDYNVNAEGKNWVEETTYDAQSVMHYLCADDSGRGQAGTKLLALTDLDKAGHRDFYLNKCKP